MSSSFRSDSFVFPADDCQDPCGTFSISFTEPTPPRTGASFSISPHLTSQAMANPNSTNFQTPKSRLSSIDKRRAASAARRAHCNLLEISTHCCPRADP